MNTAGPQVKTPQQTAQTRVLWLVLAINAGMFVVEAIAAVLAHSTGLLADAFDMLGDSLVYGVSLFALTRGVVWKHRAARINGGFEISFGLIVLADVIRRMFTDEAPLGLAMMSVAGLALAANLFCAALFMRYREQDINMRAVWLCTRNDAIANVSVIAAGLLVLLTTTQWPDLIIGLLLAGLFLHTGFKLIRSKEA